MKSEYVKPEVLLTSDLAEGVYASSSGSDIISGTNFTGVVSFNGNHGENNEHYIRKYKLTITGIPEGSGMHGTFQFKGPFRHAGCKHNIEDTISYNSSMNTVEFDIEHYGSTHNYEVFVCVDPQYYPDGLDFVSGSIVAK